MQDKLRTSRFAKTEVVQLAQNTVVNAPSDFIYDSSDFDLKAYNEAVLVIYKFQGELSANASGCSLIEGVSEEFTTSHRATAGQAGVLQVETQVPITRSGAKPVSFADLARRISSQLQGVVSTSKEITAASRRMSEGVQELNEGVGTLKRKLARLKC